jgi:hypothetical protein
MYVAMLQRHINDGVLGMQLFLLPAMMFGALFTFPKEVKMLVKERSSGMYSLAAYFVSRTMSHLPLDLLYPSTFVYLVYFLGGLRLTVRSPPPCLPPPITMLHCESTATSLLDKHASLW